MRGGIKHIYEERKTYNREKSRGESDRQTDKQTDRRTIIDNQ